jgi:hypothetical protein
VAGENSPPAAISTVAQWFEFSVMFRYAFPLFSFVGLYSVVAIRFCHYFIVLSAKPMSPHLLLCIQLSVYSVVKAT